MKAKQKKFALMIALMVGAAVLMAVQVGPILFGGGSRKRKRRNKNKPSPKAAATQSPKPPEGKSGEGGSEPGPSVDRIKIDLSAIGRRVSVYEQGNLRSPFSPAPFEQTRKEDSLSRMKLKLNGIVQCGRQRLAIIGGKVYAEGDEVKDGVKVFPIEASSATLTHGENRVRLQLSSPDSKIRGP